MKLVCQVNKLTAPVRAVPMGARHHRVMFRCTASREAEMKQMQEFKEGLNKKLQTAATSGSSPATASLDASGRDLPEVSLGEYWDAVKTLSSDGQILVMDFYTQWCGPCKLIKPTLCDWSEELSGKVNFRKFECSKENAPVGKEVQVKSVPTFIVYKGSEEVGRVVGKQEAKLRALIEEHMA